MGNGDIGESSVRTEEHIVIGSCLCIMGTCVVRMISCFYMFGDHSYDLYYYYYYVLDDAKLSCI